MVFLLTLGTAPCMLAQTIVNGDFENGTTGWTGCTVEIGTAPTYGGTGTGRVAEVDGNFSTSASDDRLLCQSISGFTIGTTYRIDLEATRRGNNTPPDPLSVTLTMDEAVSRTITRTGGYSMMREEIQFTATRTTHTLRITPDFQGSFGMLFDNLSISPVNTLPIELIAFNAEATTSNVQLMWTTASEWNNAYFTVQRSTDGLVFEEVIRMDGAGNSQTPVTYVAVDNAPVDGLAYYRLLQTDHNGASTVFDAVAVQFQRRFVEPLTVHPNPTSQGAAWLAVRDLQEEVAVPVSITDLHGSQLFLGTMTLRPGVPLDLSEVVDLPPGTYAVSVPLSGEVESVRLLVF
ncbi:MAG: hypothetical protein ACO1NQ_12060 [Flavobacteriales bacterium]